MKNAEQVSGKSSKPDGGKQVTLSLEQLEVILSEQVLSLEKAYKDMWEAREDRGEISEINMAHYRVEEEKQKAFLLVKLSDQRIKLEGHRMAGAAAK